MAIRIRTIGGITIAVCAARSVPKEGDLYLDDAAHGALSAKFSLDFFEMGFTVHDDLVHEDVKILMEQEESNNTNRDDWELAFGQNGYLNIPV